MEFKWLAGYLPPLATDHTDTISKKIPSWSEKVDENSNSGVHAYKYNVRFFIDILVICTNTYMCSIVLLALEVFIALFWGALEYHYSWRTFYCDSHVCHTQRGFEQQQKTRIKPLPDSPDHAPVILEMVAADTIFGGTGCFVYYKTSVTSFSLLQHRVMWVIMWYGTL